MRCLKLTFMIVVACCSVACIVPNKMYRKTSITNNPPSVVPPDYVSPGNKPPMAFIEFDDMGELWEQCKGGRLCQYNNALNLIERCKASGKKIVVMTFIHGWKNNADLNNNNVNNFEKLVEKFQATEPSSLYLGVYLGWRGKLTKDPITSQLTFWNRRHAAMRVGTVSMTEVILGLMAKTKEAGEVSIKVPHKFIIIGHSFGGLILERAMAQALTNLVSSPQNMKPCANYPNLKCITSPADLVILVNPAIEAIETKQLVDMLERKDINVVEDSPLMVSVTSTNDKATGFGLPFGHLFESLGKNFRRYEPPTDPDCGEKAPSQWKLYTRSAGHTAYFFTHTVTSTPCSDKDRVATFGDGGPQYYVCEKRKCNKTPYWIMSVNNTKVIDGHSGFWTDEFQQLVIELGRIVIQRAAQTELTFR